MIRIVTVLATAVLALMAAQCKAAEVKLLNASFDIARELFHQYNPTFARHWKEQTGDTVTINQSHGGSSKQARAVIDGLAADVVSMNQVIDIDAIAEKSGNVPKDWRTKLSHNSSPFSSAIVFLVRKGNPKGIKDWDDLVKPGVSVVVPNPKTSGNGRYSYLSAYAFAKRKNNGDDNAAYEFVKKLFKNVPVLDTGGRGATTSFVERQIGDVLLTFEAEVLLTIKELGADKFDVVTPSLSIEAEMPVAVVERVAKKHNTEKVARAYLEYLYAEPSQELIARNFYRPRSLAALQKFQQQFGKLTLVTIDEAFGGWANVQKTHFTDGALFDRIQRENKSQ
jgi:sulfate/thiosulfate transport system substrate-binding protein